MEVGNTPGGGGGGMQHYQLASSNLHIIFDNSLVQIAARHVYMSKPTGLSMCKYKEIMQCKINYDKIISIRFVFYYFSPPIFVLN